MAYTYTTINGQRVQTDVAAAFQRLRAGFRARFPGLDLIVSSGTRTRAEQQALYDAYRAGRGGLAAAPGYSNHEESGPRGPRAIDIRDSGKDAGVTQAGNARSNWIKANAPTYGFDPAGYRFAHVEPWHIEYTGSLGGGFAGGGGSFISFGNLSTDHIRALQSQLGVTVDGQVGAGTISALQAKVGAGVDGQIGPNTTSKIQEFVGAGVDGIWGNQTTDRLRFAIDGGWFGPPLHDLIGKDYVRKLQEQLGIHVDGLSGSGTMKALQSKVGAEPDGIFGRGTMRKIQSFVGAGADGIWGADTTNKMRAAIDAGKFGTPKPKPEPEPKPEPQPEPEPLPTGTVLGIDVAYPQTGVFDWATVREHYDFVIIKAAGGEDGIYGPAVLLDQHLVGARSAGMRVGFYFFNNNRHPVKAQADKFIEVLKPRIRPGDVIALDIEDVGSQPVQFSPAQALEFAGYMEEALGIKTFMYLNRSSMVSGDWSKVVEAGHPLWLATLDGFADGVTYLTSRTKWWKNADIVQFSSATPIPGYPHGPVDQNIGYLATLEANGFVAFPQVEPEPEPEPEPEVPSGEIDPATREFLEGLIDYIRTFLEKR